MNNAISNRPVQVISNDYAGNNDVLAHARSSGFAVALLDGKTITSTRELLAQLADQLRFPEYFGYNWDALYDCLSDLAWEPGAKIIIYVESARDLYAVLPLDVLELTSIVVDVSMNNPDNIQSLFLMLVDTHLAQCLSKLLSQTDVFC